MKTSIGSQITENTVGVRGRVGSKVRHALVAHQGAQPHVIRPKRKRALRFFWARVGHTVMFAKVNHPGMKGSKYLTYPLALHGPREGFRITIHVGGVSGELR